MSPQNEALLEAIRQFKPAHLSDIECALNVVRNHAHQIKVLSRALEEVSRIVPVAPALAAEALSEAFPGRRAGCGPMKAARVEAVSARPPEPWDTAEENGLTPEQVVALGRRIRAS